MDRTFSWKRGIVAAFAIAGLSLCANAGIPEKYGKEQKDLNGQKILRVKFLINCSYVHTSFKFPEISYIDYYPNGKVIWDWHQYDYQYHEVTGQRSDDAGSFKVKAGEVIGYEYFSGTNTYIHGDICLYPMMQLGGDNILLIDKDYILFNVGTDETVSMEWSGVPPQAIAGFGCVDKGYTYSNKDGNGGAMYYPYGPAWAMFTDFSMTPLMPDQNSVEDIGNDSADKDNQFYDLFGRKVNGQPQTPGIYICNGRKILIK